MRQTDWDITAGRKIGKRQRCRHVLYRGRPEAIVLVSEAGIEACWRSMHSGTIVQWQAGRQIFWFRDRHTASRQACKEAGTVTGRQRIRSSSRHCQTKRQTGIEAEMHRGRRRY